jgi:hypothetical protein
MAPAVDDDEQASAAAPWALLPLLHLWRAAARPSLLVAMQLGRAGGHLSHPRCAAPFVTRASVAEFRRQTLAPDEQRERGSRPLLPEETGSLWRAAPPAAHRSLGRPKRSSGRAATRAESPLLLLTSGRLRCGRVASAPDERWSSAQFAPAFNGSGRVRRARAQGPRGERCSGLACSRVNVSSARAARWEAAGCRCACSACRGEPAALGDHPREALETATECAWPVGELAARVHARERRGVQAMVSLNAKRSDRLERVPSRQFAASDARRARDVGEKDRGGVHAPDDDSPGDGCSRPDASRQLLRYRVASRPARTTTGEACGRRSSTCWLRPVSVQASVDSLQLSHRVSTVTFAMSILVSTAAGAHARGRATARSTSACESAAHTLTDWQGGRCDGRGGRPR